LAEDEYDKMRDSPYDSLGLGHTLFRKLQSYLRNFFCVVMALMIVAIVLDYRNIAQSDYILQPTSPNKMSLTN
jgi:hypothetical protein